MGMRCQFRVKGASGHLQVPEEFSLVVTSVIWYENPLAGHVSWGFQASLDTLQDRPE